MTKRFVGFILVCTFLFLNPVHGQAPSTPKPVSIHWGVKNPVRDGIKLNGTLYKPSDVQEPLPVIFTFTPYIADTYHERGMYFARNGYIFLGIDVRGRGNSEGAFEPFVHERRDSEPQVIQRGDLLARQVLGALLEALALQGAG